METVEELRQQQRSYETIATQREKEIQEGEEETARARASLPVTTSQQALRKTYAGLQGRETRREVKRVATNISAGEESLKSAKKELDEYKQEISKFKGDVDVYEAQVKDYNARVAAIEIIKKAANKGMVWAHAMYDTGYVREYAREYEKQRKLAQEGQQFYLQNPDKLKEKVDIMVGKGLSEELAYKKMGFALPSTITMEQVGAVSVAAPKTTSLVAPKNLFEVAQIKVSQAIPEVKRVLTTASKPFAYPVTEIGKSIKNIWQDKQVKEFRNVIGGVLMSGKEQLEKVTIPISKTFDMPIPSKVKALQVREEYFAKRYDTLQKDIETFNKKYGSKELPEEEYEKAMKEQARLEGEQSYISYASKDVEYMKGVYENEREREPFLMVTSFVKGGIEFAPTMVGYAGGLLSDTGATLAAQKRGLLSLPSSIINKPFSTIGYLGGQLAAGYALGSLFKGTKPVSKTSSLSAIQKAKYYQSIWKKTNVKKISVISEQMKLDFAKSGIKIGKKSEAGYFEIPKPSGRITRGYVLRNINIRGSLQTSTGIILKTTKAGKIQQTIAVTETPKNLMTFDYIKGMDVWGKGKSFNVKSNLKVLKKTEYSSGAVSDITQLKQTAVQTGKIKGTFAPTNIKQLLTIPKAIKQITPKTIFKGKSVEYTFMGAEKPITLKGDLFDVTIGKRRTGISTGAELISSEAAPITFDVLKTLRKKTPLMKTFADTSSKVQDVSLIKQIKTKGGSLISSMETSIGANIPTLIKPRKITQTQVTTNVLAGEFGASISPFFRTEEISLVSEKPKEKEEVRLLRKPITKLSSVSIEEEFATTIPAVTELQTSKIAITPSEKQELSLALVQPPKQSTTLISTQKIPLKPTTPKLKFMEKRMKPMTIKVPKEETKFEAIGIRFGKEVKLGKGTKKETEKKIERFLTGTLGASGFLKKVGGEKVRAEETELLKVPSFRKSKVSPYLIVEKKEKRLKRGSGETKEIKMFKKRSMRRSFF
jgi:hypothetical protein